MDHPTTPDAPARKKASRTPPKPPESARNQYQRFLETESRRQHAMSSQEAVSAAYVSQVILKDLGRSNGAWTVEPEPIKARDSWVFKAHAPDAPWPLAVKVFCTAIPPEKATKQADLLQHYHASMAGRPELTVPAPWTHLPEHRTIVMQWIDEPRMDQLLRDARRRRDTRLRLFAAAGRWLRHFHAQSTYARDLPPKVHNNRVQIDMLLGGEEGAGHRVRDTVFRKAYATLVHHADEFAHTPIPHIMTHGDFGPHNLFHGPARTVGFDLVPQRKSPLADICHFFVEAELRKPFWTRPGMLGPTGLERHDVAAFLQAYGPIEPYGSVRLATYIQLAEVLIRWSLLISHFRTGHRRNMERMVRVIRFRRMAKYAMTALQRDRGFASPD